MGALTSRRWSRIGWWALLPAVIGTLSGIVGGGWWLAPPAFVVWWWGTLSWWRLAAHAKGHADLRPHDPLWIGLLGMWSAAVLPVVILRRTDVDLSLAVVPIVGLALPGLVAIRVAFKLQDALLWRPTAPVGTAPAGVGRSSPGG